MATSPIFNLIKASEAFGTGAFRQVLVRELAEEMGIKAGDFSVDVLSSAETDDAIRLDTIVSYTEVKAGCQATFEPHVVRYQIDIRKTDGQATIEEMDHRSYFGE